MSENKVYKHECSHEEWQEFIKAMQSGKEFEMDEEMWYYWLEALPPVFMGRQIQWPDPDNDHHTLTVRANFGFAEGCEPITAFWRRDGRYYGIRTSIINKWG